MEDDECCFTKSQLNYFRVCHLATNILPSHLRHIFIQLWNLFHAQNYGCWDNSDKNGQDFVAMESASNRKRNQEMLKVMQNGNVEVWDCTKLFYAILFSSSVGRNLHPDVRKHINSLRDFRNKSFAHVIQGEVSSSDFQVALNQILQAFVVLQRDTSDVRKIQNSTSFSTEEVYELQDKIERERVAQMEFDERISNLEERVMILENKMCNMDDEDGEYSDIVDVSLRNDTSIAGFSILPNKLSHPSIDRHEVYDMCKTLNDLRSIHTDKITSIFVIGEPLSGKTECVRQICMKLSKQRYLVATLDGRMFQSFSNSLKQIAIRLGFFEENFPSFNQASITTQIEILSLFVKEKLANLHSWLLVVDGVSLETKELLKYLPQRGDLGAGQIIVATQDKSLLIECPCSVPTVLDKLTLKESMELLSVVSGEIPDDLAKFLAEQLDYQPALLVAAAKKAKLLSIKTGMPMAKTWKVMLENMKARFKDEWPYFIAELDDDSRSKLRTVIQITMKRSNVVEECFHLLLLAKGVSLPLEFVSRFLADYLCMSEGDVRLTICDCPLFRVIIPDSLQISSVIYKCLCDVLAPSIRTERMIHRLRQISHFSGKNSSDAIICRAFRVISQKIMQYLGLLDLCFPDLDEQRSLHYELGKAFLYVLVDYSSAVRCFTKAISIYEGSNDIAHLEYAQLLNSLGNVLRLTGSMEEAYKYLSKSLKLLNEISCEKLSEEVASCLSSMGLVCLSQGDLDRARQLHNRALKIREQIYGSDHITTASSLNNIGGVYHELGDLATAKNYYWRSLEIKGRNYGWDFPHVANSFNNIAEISHEQGDLCGAVSVHRRALKIRRRLYGDEHPDVANSLNNIGVIYHKLQEFSSARKYHTAALEIRRKIYGDHHLIVASSLSSLGEVYYDEGDLAAAEECHVEALSIRQRHFTKSSDPQLIASLHNLMMVYVADQKVSAAISYAYEVVKACRLIYGSRDRRTLQAFHKLAELSKCETLGQTTDVSFFVHEHIERLSCL